MTDRYKESIQGARDCVERNKDGGVYIPDLLVVIDSQRAEVERTKENNKAIMQTIADIHTEAIKEFAERLKDEASEKVGIDEDFLYYDFDDEFKTFDSVADVIKFLSAIVIKEMVGEDK